MEVEHEMSDEELASRIAEFRDDPLGYVMFVFPWASEPAIQKVKLAPQYLGRFDSEYGPDVWACELLDELGAEIRKRAFDGKQAVEPIRFSTVSGHYVGKTTMAAWLVKFILDTRPFSCGCITAGTDYLLRHRTWPAVGKWHGLSRTRRWFHYDPHKMTLWYMRRSYSWGCRGVSPMMAVEAFAGLCVADSTPFFIFDEAAPIRDELYEVREAAFTDGEPMVFDFGTGTSDTGRFRENSEGRFRHMHNVRHLDTRASQLANQETVRELIDNYGEDSDFVRVRVRGLFPSRPISEPAAAF